MAIKTAAKKRPQFEVSFFAHSSSLALSANCLASCSDANSLMYPPYLKYFFAFLCLSVIWSVTLTSAPTMPHSAETKTYHLFSSGFSFLILAAVRLRRRQLHCCSCIFPCCIRSFIILHFSFFCKKSM